MATSTLIPAPFSYSLLWSDRLCSWYRSLAAAVPSRRASVWPGWWVLNGSFVIPYHTKVSLLSRQYSIILVILLILTCVLTFVYLKNINSSSLAEKQLNDYWQLQKNGTNAMDKVQTQVSESCNGVSIAHSIYYNVTSFIRSWSAVVCMAPATTLRLSWSFQRAAMLLVTVPRQITPYTTMAA